MGEDSDTEFAKFVLPKLHGVNAESELDALYRAEFGMFKIHLQPGCEYVLDTFKALITFLSTNPDVGEHAHCLKLVPDSYVQSYRDAWALPTIVVYCQQTSRTMCMRVATAISQYFRSEFPLL